MDEKEQKSGHGEKRFGGKFHGRDGRRPFHKDGRPFHKDGKPFHKDFHKDGKPFHKRKLEVGVEYVDREMGVGIVRKITDDGITVAFGDTEKLFPRHKREHRDFHRDGDKKPFVKAAPIGSKVFTFDVQPGAAGQKKEFGVNVGTPVEDEILGKGEVTRITERGVYVTYEATGEHVLYPKGLPHKLFPSAQKKEKKEVKEPPKGAARTYTVPAAAPRKPKKQAAPKPAKETRRGNTRYIEVAEGTAVISPDHGRGFIAAIGDGTFTARFDDGAEKEYPYPVSFVNGDIEIVE